MLLLRGEAAKEVEILWGANIRSCPSARTLWLDELVSSLARVRRGGSLVLASFLYVMFGGVMALRKGRGGTATSITRG